MHAHVRTHTALYEALIIVPYAEQVEPERGAGFSPRSVSASVALELCLLAVKQIYSKFYKGKLG